MKPSQPVGGSAIPSAPPTTQAICSHVSERANADARRLSGTSRWMIASSDTLPSALVTAATNGDDGGHREAVEDRRQHGDRGRGPRGDEHQTVRRRACAGGMPAAVPAKLPSPAAAATAPRASVASQPSA